MNIKLPKFNNNRNIGLFDFSYFFNNSPEICFVINNLGYFVKANNYAIQTLGFGSDEFRKITLLYLVHPHSRDAVINCLKEPDNLRTNEIAIRIKNKSEIYIDVLFQMQRQNSELYNIVLKEVKKDLNVEEELTLKNRELAEAKAKDDAMLENIGDGVIGINDGGEIIFINSQAQTMLGYTEVELKGKLVFHSISLVAEDNTDVTMDERPIHKALSTKTKVVSRDWFYKRKDGTKFPVSITATPVVIFDKVIGGVVVFRDITREKEVDRMKTEFISLASHQLRTPLSAMKWLLELLLNEDVGKLTDEQKEVVANVYGSNQRMIDLVNDLLNISRIESGRIVIDPQPVDLALLAKDVLKELESKINEKKLKVTIEVTENLPKINADKGLIRNVFMNILANSIKYSPVGKDISLIVKEERAVVICQFIDQGYGIPQSQQYRIFEKFFRATNTAKLEADGTGLGLYLVKAIVDSSGGTVSFVSEENKGTTFTVVLPKEGPKPKTGEMKLN